MNAQEAAEILGITRRRNGDLREMVRALTLFPWFNTAEDAKRREAALPNSAAARNQCCAVARSIPRFLPPCGPSRGL